MKMNSIKRLHLLFCIFATAAFLWSCCCSTTQILEPSICYTPPPRYIEKLPSPFTPLTLVERSQDWGKELYLGKAFARQMDLYRALTCFKSALILIPRKETARRLEIEYEIFLSYYIANKFQEAVEAFESSNLIAAPEDFPALKDLLITLYDAYMQNDQPERACRILNLIGTTDLETANNLILETAIINADVPTIEQAAECSSAAEDVHQFLGEYTFKSKSVAKAKTLNAILPGAGYYYVGQKKTAVTSFLINALFIAATYQFAHKGYIPAAIITGSLEMGWYFGGINGAGLAAHEYNERLYECLGKNLLVEKGFFPVLMLQASF